jgi:hypothetical protein
MKFLEILLSFIATQGKSFIQGGTEALSEKIVNNARRVAILLAVIVLAIVLFSTGFSMAYTSAIKNLEENGAWLWSAGVLSGMALAAIALTVLCYSLGEKRWLDATGINAKADATPPPAPPRLLDPMLEAALAVLITEFANGLKENRQNAAAPKTEASQV